MENNYFLLVEFKQQKSQQLQYTLNPILKLIF